MTHAEFASQLSQHLTTVIGGLADAPATLSPSDAAVEGARWVAALDVGADGAPLCSVAFADAGARALSAITAGLESPPDALVVDTLREVVAQSLGAMVPHDQAHGVPSRSVHLVRVVDGTPLPPSGDRTSVTIVAGSLPTPLLVTITGRVDPARVMEQVSSSEASSAPAGRIDVILDIELPLVVRFGRTELPLRALAKMGPGSLIDLGRSADEPVELLVSNRVVARGEVVVVSGNYGVRVLDVVSPRNRASLMEA